MEAGMRVKMEGKNNNLFELISKDDSFRLSMNDLEALSAPENLIGTCPYQVTNYLQKVVYPLLDKNKDTVKVFSKAVGERMQGTKYLMPKDYTVEYLKGGMRKRNFNKIPVLYGSLRYIKGQCDGVYKDSFNGQNYAVFLV